MTPHTHTHIVFCSCSPLTFTQHCYTAFIRDLAGAIMTSPCPPFVSVPLRFSEWALSCLGTLPKTSQGPRTVVRCRAYHWDHSTVATRIVFLFPCPAQENPGLYPGHIHCAPSQLPCMTFRRYYKEPISIRIHTHAHTHLRNVYISPLKFRRGQIFCLEYFANEYKLWVSRQTAANNT